MKINKQFIQKIIQEENIAIQFLIAELSDPNFDHIHNEELEDGCSECHNHQDESLMEKCPYCNTKLCDDCLTSHINKKHSENENPAKYNEYLDEQINDSNRYRFRRITRKRF